MLDFTIKMLFSCIFGEGIIDVFNDKKVVWQKCVSARVTQTSRNYLIFDLTDSCTQFVLPHTGRPRNRKKKKR